MIVYRKKLAILFVVVVAVLLGYYFGFFIPQKNADIAERQNQVRVIEEAQKQGQRISDQAQEEQALPATEVPIEQTQWAQEPPAIETPVEELILDGEELKSYYAAYEDPFVIHVRKALNGYLAGTNVGIDTPEVTIEKKSFDDGTPDGLASFDKRYYESKFVVLSLDEALFGGREIALVFQDKPDRIFTAWVYKYGDEDRYDLRGFWEHKEATRNIDSQLKRYGKYIFDKEHSL